MSPCNPKFPELIVGILPVKVTLYKLLQYWNVLSPILVTLLGIVMLVKLEEPWKRLLFKVVMLFGKITVTKLMQQKNAFWPIIVTLSGIVILVKPLQDWNAFWPIVWTLFGIDILVKPEQALNAPLSIPVM